MSDAVDRGRECGRQSAARRANATIPVAKMAALFMVHPKGGQASASLSKT